MGKVGRPCRVVALQQGSWGNWWVALGELVGWAGGSPEVSPSREGSSIMFLMTGLGDTVRQRTAVVVVGWEREREREKTSETHPWVLQVAPRWPGRDPDVQGGVGGGDTGCRRTPTVIVLAGALVGLRLFQPLHQTLRDLLELLCHVVALPHGEDDLVLHHDAARSLAKGTERGFRGDGRGDLIPPHPTIARLPLT